MGLMDLIFGKKREKLTEASSDAEKIGIIGRLRFKSAAQKEIMRGQAARKEAAEKRKSILARMKGRRAE